MVIKKSYFFSFQINNVLTKLPILLTIFINLISCTKADPKISLLKLNFPAAPKLNGNAFSLSNPNQPITISGSCDKRISELKMSKDAGVTWSAISFSSSDLNCSDEFFSFSISDPGAFVGAAANSSFKGTIGIAGVTKFGKTPMAEFTIEYNQSSAPTISISDVAVQENVGSASVIVTLNKALTTPLTFDWSTASGSAIANLDFTMMSGTATIVAGDTSTTLTIPIINDSFYENSENFTVLIANPSVGNILTSQSLVTITNDADAMPTISLAGNTLTEGNTGTANLAFTVTLSGVSGADVIVNYATSDGTATAGSDYTAISNGTATITAGQTTTSFNVSIIGDTAIENNETFTVTLGGGSGYSTSGSNLTATGTIFDNDMPIVVPLYAGHSDWNKYVKNDGSTIFNASNTACTGSEAGNYHSCIHGGEKRKVVASGFASCTNLTVTDNLGVFDWFCSDTSGTAIFYSVGLKNGKGLRDLITASGTWQSNFVTIYLSANVIASSASSVWWSNPLQDLSAGGYNNSGTASVYNLSTAGMIYFITSNLATYGYQIANDEISIVTLGSAKLMKFGPDSNPNCSTTTGNYSPSAGNTISILCGGSRQFLWIEANMDADTGATYAAYGGLYTYDWKHSRIHNTKVSPTHSNNAFYAMTLNNSHYNLVTGVDIYSVASGFELKNSTYNIVRHLKVTEAKYPNSNCKSIYLDTASDYNNLYDIYVTNHNSSSYGTSAITVESSDNVISRLNVSNINGNASSGVAGIYLSPTASNNILTQIVVASTADAGVKLLSAYNNIISFYTAANNVSNGIYLDGLNTNGNVFNSLAITNVSDPIQSNVAGTYTSTTANEYHNLAISNYTNWAIHIQDSISTFNGYFFAGITPACSPSGVNLNSSCAGGGVTVIASDIASALKGPVTSDSANGTATGVRSFPTINTFELWTSFESFFRNWGKLGGSYPVAGNKGYCDSAESCQIWDYRVANSSLLHNRSITGSSLNPALTTSSVSVINCVAGINGDLTLTANGITFMQNAMEINGDLVGNDNGLCESSERCIYAPNIGAYQGEGDYLTGGSCITSGTVSGAKIYQYPVTGI